MKKLFACLLISLAFMACQKEDTDNSVAPTNMSSSTNTTGTISLPDQTVILQGNFASSAHTTTGAAKIYQDKNKNLTLVLENFKTDAGPDLRIYLAEDKSITNFIQLSDKVQNGNVQFSIPANTDLKKQNHILIWCKQFSVLFGYSQLK